MAVIGVQNSPGTVLLTISDMSVETEMEVDETSIPSVRVGQQAQVRVDAYPNQIFDGVVTEVGGSPHRPDQRHRRHQVQGQGPAQVAAPHHQARPLGRGRHPDRLPEPGPGGADPGAGGGRPQAASPGQAARRRARPRRGGGRLSDGGRQGALPGHQDRPHGRPLGRGAVRAPGRRDAHHRPVQGPAGR